MGSTRGLARGVLLVSVLAGGCARQCPLPGQVRMAELVLYFGQDIPGGGQVDAAAWEGFAGRVLTPAFPDGFTEYDASGQWRDAGTGRLVRERTRVVQVFGAAPAASVAGVTAAYRAAFRQVAVGVVSREACAAF